MQISRVTVSDREHDSSRCLATISLTLGLTLVVWRDLPIDLTHHNIQ